MLDDILVVSIEQAVAAPLCTQRLADAGARVIKVERAEGDLARGYDKAVHGESAYFVWLNHGKQSIVLDIKNADDATLLASMIAKADVFVQNLAPGASARAGFGSGVLRERYPSLITCDISGYGDVGPWQDMKAYDLLIQCETGLASITGAPDAPGRVGVSVADIACGTNAYTAILEALYQRQATGVGKAISISLFDCLAEWMAVPLLHFDYTGTAPARVGLSHPSIAPYGAFRCRDGNVVVIAVQNEREWRRLCSDVLMDPDLAQEACFLSNPLRVANRPALDSRIGAVFAELDRDELARRLQASGIAFGGLKDVSGLSAHPQLRRRRVESATGPVDIPSSPVGGGHDDARPSHVPTLNSHGAVIRGEFA